MPSSLRVSPQYIEYVKKALVRNSFARQQDLAESLDISRDTISRFFNGKSVGYLNFIEICKSLNIDLTEVSRIEGDARNGEILADLEEPSLLQNLPHQNYIKFVGRSQELQDLFRYISPSYRLHITTIEGIGGVGKTSLALEAAYQCKQAKLGTVDNEKIPIFDAIIFTSAKESSLAATNLITRPKRESSIESICRAISHVLSNTVINQRISLENQISQTYKSLAEQRTLIIIDNFETVRGKARDDILSFLSDLPASVQAIITTREKVSLFSSIYLQELTEAESLEIIQQNAAEKHISITSEQAERLYYRFGGVPLALVYAVGQRAQGYSIKRIIQPRSLLQGKPAEDIARFCFEGSVAPLRGTTAHTLLMALGLFKSPPTLGILSEVAGLSSDPIEVEDGLIHLQKLSLVKEENERYHMLSLTREYAIAELYRDETSQSFHQEARTRWINQYLKLAKEYGAEDWENYNIKYEHLEEELANLEEVLQWLADQEKYEIFKKLWNALDHFVDLSGHWQIRINRWHWLEEESLRRGDYLTHIEALSAQAWTLMFIGEKSNELAAEKLFEKTFQFQGKISDIYRQARLYVDFSVFNKIRGNYPEAIELLEKAKALMEKIEIDKKYRKRFAAARIYYEGEARYMQEEYHEAEVLFLKVVDIGIEIGWPRFVSYAYNFLGNIAIIKKRDSDAEEFLENGYTIAMRHKEKRRIALIQASYAWLYCLRKDCELAREWANKALQGFSNEGIINEAHELKYLLKNLDESCLIA